MPLETDLIEYVIDFAAIVNTTKAGQLERMRLFLKSQYVRKDTRTDVT